MLPLAGTVVALEHAIAAPFCTRQLADQGATPSAQHPKRSARVSSRDARRDRASVGAGARALNSQSSRNPPLKKLQAVPSCR